MFVNCHGLWLNPRGRTEIDTGDDRSFKKKIEPMQHGMTHPFGRRVPVTRHAPREYWAEGGAYATEFDGVMRVRSPSNRRGRGPGPQASARLCPAAIAADCNCSRKERLKDYH